MSREILVRIRTVRMKGTVSIVPHTMGATLSLPVKVRSIHKPLHSGGMIATDRVGATMVPRPGIILMIVNKIKFGRIKVEKNLEGGDLI